MDLPTLRRRLLELVGTAEQARPSELNTAEWQRLDQLAALHRLQPLLHAQHASNAAIPASIRHGWHQAHRTSALQAMSHRAALADCCRLLEQAGHAPIALKGAWLGAQAYPELAQRPMRDLDLLVPLAGVRDAYQLLLEAGYREAEPAEMALDDVIRLDKHMPALISPRGTIIELHHHLWEPDGRLDHASPATDETALRARAVLGDGGIRYLAPQDTLAHLIVHAVYSHRLDCGPLLLPDIDFLLRAAPIDWPQFWDQARSGHWRGGARLVLDLVARYRRAAPIDFGPDHGVPSPPELLAAAPDLLLQQLDTRQSAGLVAAALKAGPAKLFQRLRGQRSAAGEAAVTRDMHHEGGALGWATSRAWRSVSELVRPDVRRQSRQLAALSRWLDQ